MKLIGIFASCLFFMGNAPSKIPSDLYELSFSTPKVFVKAGEKGTLEASLAVIVKDGYVHSKSPFSFQVEASDLQFPKNKFKRVEAAVGGTDEKARLLTFKIPFTSAKVGESKVSATADFYLCTEKICNHETIQASSIVVTK